MRAMSRSADSEPGLWSAAETMDTLDFHQSMIHDRRRVEAFRAAIEAAVQPGDVVLDIGTGTGLLACLAARAGARKVYAVEEGGIATVAAGVVADNGYDDREQLGAYALWSAFAPRTRSASLGTATAL